MNRKVLALAIMSIVAASSVIGGILIFGNDSSAPYVRIRNPIHAQMYTSADLLLKIDAWEDFFGKIDSVWYNWEGVNVSYTSETVVEFSEGEITLHAWANDTKGNLGSTTISFVIDTSLPSITILSPTAGVHSSQSQLLEISASEFGEGELDSVWYNWDGVNVTYLMPIEIAFEEREIVLTAWANDTAGNEASASVIFTIDSDYPDITIVSPLSTRYSSASHTLEITATDNYGVDEIWYSWKGPTSGSGGTGDANITYDGPEEIVFNKGVNIVKVWANDTHGNVAFKKMLFVVQGNNFSSVWDTTKTCGGSSASNQVKLPLVSSGRYDFIVDWGDGSSNLITAWDQVETTHTYGSQGIYTINITGVLSGWQFNNGGDKLKISDIKNWGDLLLSNDVGHFYGCSNLKVSADDKLFLADASSLAGIFRNCIKLDKINRINEWDTSNIITTEYAFSNASLFNESIDAWDVSKVTNMNNMFSYATSFNRSLNSWDTSRVIDMSNMFMSAKNFSQPIGNWDVSKVTNMGGLFRTASSFNQDINGWDVSKVVNMNGMFRSASSFNQSLLNWNVSSVTTMFRMFEGAISFNQDLSEWDVSSVTDMEWMFYYAYYFNQDLSSWNVSNVRTMNQMFDYAWLSTNNYDALLIGWSELPLQHGVSFHGGLSRYSAGTAATARDILINTYGWVITDGGQA